jgi:hypothetical protein
MCLAAVSPTRYWSYFFLFCFIDLLIQALSFVLHWQGSLAIAIPEYQIGLPIDQVQPRVIFRDFAQHGNAWPTGGCNFVRSVSISNNSLPSTFELVNLNGSVLQSFPNACVLYHGYASVAGYELAGCGSAIEGGGHVMALQYRSETGRSVLQQLLYPHNNMRTGTLYANEGMSYAIGNYGSTTAGYNAIIRVTPTQGTIDSLTDVLFFPREAWPASTATARSTCAMGMQQGGNNLFLVALPDGYLYIYRSDNFSIVPTKVDLFPETRANMTRATYSCRGNGAVRLEIGSRYAFVVRTNQDPLRLMRIDLDAGVSDMFISLPSTLSSASAIGDMLVVVPESSSQSPCAAATAGGSGNNGGSPGTGSPGTGTTGAASSDSSSTSGTVIALAVLLGIAILALIVAIVAFVLYNRRRNPHAKLENPPIELRGVA